MRLVSIPFYLTPKTFLLSWIYNRTRLKWKRCKKDHKSYLKKLNAKITKQEIKRSINSFSNNKAEGPDRLDIKFFKKCKESGKKILLFLFNVFFDFGILPRNLKKRWIIPIKKPGKLGNIVKELRPVSLTSYVGKLFEKVLVFRLVTYIIRLQLLANVHFAYLAGRSTSDCLIYMIDQIEKNMNNGIKTHSVFFDFSSAFDCVHHGILTWKLEHEFFIKGRFLIIIQNG